MALPRDDGLHLKKGKTKIWICILSLHHQCQTLHECNLEEKNKYNELYAHRSNLPLDRMSSLGLVGIWYSFRGFWFRKTVALWMDNECKITYKKFFFGLHEHFYLTESYKNEMRRRENIDSWTLTIWIPPMTENYLCGTVSELTFSSETITSTHF